MQAYSANFANISAREDTIAASVVFANGALGTVSATSAVGYGFPQRLGIYGELAGVQIEGEHVARAKGDGLPARLSDVPGPSDPGPMNDGSPFASSNVAYMRLIEDFSEAIRSDRPPLVSGAEGRRSLAAVLAIYAAAGL